MGRNSREEGVKAGQKGFPEARIGRWEGRTHNFALMDWKSVISPKKIG